MSLRLPGKADRTQLELSSVWRDLRVGEEGLVLRIGLSLATAAGLVSLLMFFLGAIEVTGRVNDEHVIIGLALTGATWCGTLVWLWASYRRWRRLLQTIFFVLAVWLIAIPTAVLVGRTTASDGFWIATCILGAVAATVAVIVVNTHWALAGRPLADIEGRIVVACPACGYSMVGLESCVCPECGTTYTIDTLIAGQDYAAVRQVATVSPDPATEPASLAQTTP